MRIARVIHGTVILSADFAQVLHQEVGVVSLPQEQNVSAWT